MKVRAKFKVFNIEHSKDPSPSEVWARVDMQAAYNDGDPGNAEWSKYTPSASCSMHITNPSAIDAFEVGKFYFVDFTPAE
jgi:hypothetical protein